MTLSSMVVSRDWPEVSVLECILGALHIEVEVEPQPFRAKEKLAKSKIDALVVDCDLDGSAGFLSGLEDTLLLQTVPLLILGSYGSRQVNPSVGTFFFRKPISVEQAVRTLSAARTLIVDGRLRYHRHPINTPVLFRCGMRKKVDAQLMNLSQGGLRVHLTKPLPSDGPLQVSFALPGTTRQVRMQAEVAWQNHHGHAGVRFVSHAGPTKRDLQLWLEQRYLTN
ncbi:MAG: PilZ domain-containing protein [Terriglobales bacterium]